MDKLAGDVLALADDAGWDRFDVLGHDWGGAVAWYLGSRHADRVRTISVASTPHPRALWEAFKGPQALRSWYMLVFQVPWLPETLLGAGRRPRGSLDVQGQRRRGSRGDGPVAERPTHCHRCPQLVSDHAGLGCSRCRPSRRPESVRVERRRHRAGPRRAERTRDFVDGDYTFVELSGASHWIPDERPDELAEAVLAHLERHPA